MSDDQPLRPLFLPSSDLKQLRIPKGKQPARLWYKVHPCGFSAIFFSLNPEHRFSHPDCPDSILYLGTDPDTCLFERFGGLMYHRHNTIPSAVWQANGVSAVAVPSLHICDLTHARTLSALKADMTSLMHNDLAIPQAWGLAIQQHPARFQAIKFASRFNRKPCLALFKRDALERALAESNNQRLADSDAAVEWLHKHRVSLY